MRENPQDLRRLADAIERHAIVTEFLDDYGSRVLESGLLVKTNACSQCEGHVEVTELLGRAVNEDLERLLNRVRQIADADLEDARRALER